MPIRLLLFLLFPLALGAQFQGGFGGGFSEATTVSANALPLSFVSFTATDMGGSVLLDWQTDDEVDTDYFTLERARAVGADFTPIATLSAAGDAKGYRQYYSYTDATPLPGVSHYRIVTTDYDGALTFSPIASVSRAGALTSGFTIYPNPAPTGSTVSIQATNSDNTAARVDLYDIGGRNVLSSTRLTALSTQELRAGTYLVRIRDSQGSSKSQLLVLHP